MKPFLPLHPPRPHGRPQGFSLLESLLVVVILSGIVALSIPAVLDVMKATRLTSAGSQVSGHFLEAQGLALAFSSDIELRLYKAPLEKPADGSNGQYFQLYQWTEKELGSGDDGFEEQARLERVGSRLLLPEGVAVSENEEFTSLWKLKQQTETTEEGERDYIAIRFRPDGSTDLPEQGAWFLTLLDQRNISNPGLPPDFYALSLDAVTAKLKTWRPE